MTACPLCKGALELVTDGIVVTKGYVHVGRTPSNPGGVKMARTEWPTPFYACTACEFCEVVDEMGASA